MILISQIFAVLLGLIWLNKGRNVSSTNYIDIEGILFFILINQSFISIFGTVFTFPLERSIVLRERASGMYRVSAYYLSKTLVEVPRSILFSLFFCVVVRKNCISFIVANCQSYIGWSV